MKADAKRFLVDVGNSSTGPIGFCMRVRATTAKQALEFAREALPERIDVESYIDPDKRDRLEYFAIYLNPSALTLDDVHDESE